MRILKDAAGEFYLDEEPMRLEGEVAEQFLSDMEERNQKGNTPQQEAFLQECTAEYRKKQNPRNNTMKVSRNAFTEDPGAITKLAMKHGSVEVWDEGKLVGTIVIPRARENEPNPHIGTTFRSLFDELKETEELNRLTRKKYETH